MKAVIISQPAGPEVLEIQEVAQPSPAPDQILVRVRASALNRADLLQRQGHYPAPFGSPQDIPGMEFAGEVAAVGSLVQLWEGGAARIRPYGGRRPRRIRHRPGANGRRNPATIELE